MTGWTGVAGTHDFKSGRPPVPAIEEVAAPPEAELAVRPDGADLRPIDLPGLDDVDWPSLSHAFGAADEVPDMIRALADPRADDWDETLDELLGDDLLHQGACYSATGPAMPFLAALVTSGSPAAHQRRELCVWLVHAADQWALSLLGDTEQAAVGGRNPVPEAWTAEVRAAVGAQVPALLGRWDAEVPAVRFELARLAALFPEHGMAVADRVEAMADELEDTREGAYLDLALALIDRDGDESFELAEAIVAWDDDQDESWLEIEDADPALRSATVLAGA